MDRRRFLVTSLARLDCAGGRRGATGGQGVPRRISPQHTACAGRSLRGGISGRTPRAGWAEGQNLVIEYRFSDGRNERFPALAAELVQMNVDLIVAGNTPAALAAKQATTTMPIVFSFVGDPVGSGIVASLARPGGNLAGLGGLFPGMHVKMLELLKEAVPTGCRTSASRDVRVRCCRRGRRPHVLQ
jgi:hypothetical protein